MRQVALVIDSTAGLSAELAQELNITVVSASHAFADERALDCETDWDAFYQRMARHEEAPRTFGVPEASWRQAFELALEAAGSVVALVTPFDVSPSFTTAVAAMLALQDERP